MPHENQKFFNIHEHTGSPCCLAEFSVFLCNWRLSRRSYFSTTTTTQAKYSPMPLCITEVIKSVFQKSNLFQYLILVQMDIICHTGYKGSSVITRYAWLINTLPRNLITLYAIYKSHSDICLRWRRLKFYLCSNCITIPKGPRMNSGCSIFSDN